MTANTTTRNNSFTAADGSQWTVWNVKPVERDARSSWTGYSRTVRTYAQNDVTGEVVEVEAGCAFKANRAVNESR